VVSQFADSLHGLSTSRRQLQRNLRVRSSHGERPPPLRLHIVSSEALDQGQGPSSAIHHVLEFIRALYQQCRQGVELGDNRLYNFAAQALSPVAFAVIWAKCSVSSRCSARPARRAIGSRPPAYAARWLWAYGRAPLDSTPQERRAGHVPADAVVASSERWWQAVLMQLLLLVAQSRAAVVAYRGGRNGVTAGLASEATRQHHPQPRPGNQVGEQIGHVPWRRDGLMPAGACRAGEWRPVERAGEPRQSRRAERVGARPQGGLAFLQRLW